MLDSYVEKESEHPDNTVFIASLWMSALGIFLCWIPLLGPAVAGFVGGRRAGSLPNALLAATIGPVTTALVFMTTGKVDEVAAAFASVLGEVDLSGLVSIGFVGLMLFALAPYVMGAVIGGITSKQETETSMTAGIYTVASGAVVAFLVASRLSDPILPEAAPVPSTPVAEQRPRREAPKVLSQEQAGQMLHAALLQAKPYDWSPDMGCIALLFDESEAAPVDGWYYFETREDHIPGKCDGDPDVSPLLDMFRVHAQSGAVEWQSPDEAWKSPQDFLKYRKS